MKEIHLYEVVATDGTVMCYISVDMAIYLLNLFINHKDGDTHWLTGLHVRKATWPKDVETITPA